MSCLKCVKIFGIMLATLAIVASLGTEGYYAWKTYAAVNECNPGGNETAPDVCIYNELEVRTYIGLAEGAVGIIISIVFLLGFALPSVAIIWVWVVWALGIASYNAYCVQDYLVAIKSQQNVEYFPWDTFIDEDYGTFFLVAMISVLWYGPVLLITIPMTTYLTFTYKSDNLHSFTVDPILTGKRNYDNDAYEMERRS